MSIAHETTPRRRTVAPPTIREHRIPTAGSKPYIAVEGRDGCLWFCESGASKIGRLAARANPQGRRDLVEIAADWTTLFCLLDDRIEGLDPGAAGSEALLGSVFGFATQGVPGS